MRKWINHYPAAEVADSGIPAVNAAGVIAEDRLQQRNFMDFVPLTARLNRSNRNRLKPFAANAGQEASPV
ncbi:hypothetical protein [Bhargavaea ginsengi]|uniref:hypothetical protein n=1 Tax=Bhargavaea ginsengi TaxID=426757 RepID=UPI00203DB63A|nr:hypothetical protein [Bhargavaea ginsengi]MCM3087063.1 hypothetical protein [Bhargavaea ginsengi]